MGTPTDVLPANNHTPNLRKPLLRDKLSMQWHKLDAVRFGLLRKAIVVLTFGFLAGSLSRWVNQSIPPSATHWTPILEIILINYAIVLICVSQHVPSIEHNTIDHKEEVPEDTLPRSWHKPSAAQSRLLWSALLWITFYYWKLRAPPVSSSFSIDAAPPLISSATFHQRQLTLARTLYAQNISAYISEPSPNSAYYYNISAADWHLSERSFIFVLTPEVTTEGSTRARVRVVVPSFEETRAKTQLNIAVRSDGIEYLPWEESESPYESLKDLAPSKAEHRSTVLVDENARVLVASEIQAALGDGVDVRASTREIRELRERKTEEELALLKYVNEMTLHAIRLLRPKLHLGITETEAQALLVKVYDSIGFKVKTNAALPHGSSADRVLQKEDLVLVDTGASYGGYVADITRTFALSNSEIPKEHLEIWDLVRRAQQAAYDRVTLGVRASDIDLAARQVIAEDGLADKFTHRLGHGIGLEGHEAPYLHAGNTNTTILPGNTFSNEPGVYIEGQVGVRLEDCWFMDTDGHAPFARLDKMAKSKNHTAHNQTKKAHKNGIKKPKLNRHPSMNGVDPKFRRNLKFAQLGTQKLLRAQRKEANGEEPEVKKGKGGLKIVE
ncbi:60S ribosomal protein L29 [Phaffia rhodozyma]|uniref:60S ribosomal protein L29 n=1 Tax=Phaffia rhodozyma TaxID=264483 RepID=A0A0F7SH11_PHARH|nr:60S ribosomal protein L29 [Phaffia rhodozyma]